MNLLRLNQLKDPKNHPRLFPLLAIMAGIVPLIWLNFVYEGMPLWFTLVFQTFIMAEVVILSYEIGRSAEAVKPSEWTYPVTDERGHK